MVHSACSVSYFIKRDGMDMLEIGRGAELKILYISRRNRTQHIMIDLNME